MKIFLSWSGQDSQSHQVAKALRDWLPNVIQQLEPWLSSQDIKTGTNWQAELDKQIADTSFGILAITHESKDKPYLLFEAGALSRQVKDKAYVCPYYFGITSTDFNNPISVYQGEEATREGTLKLLQTINGALEESCRISEKSLEKYFDKWWEDLNSKLLEIKDYEESNSGFIAPRQDRELLEEILQLVRKQDRKPSSYDYLMSDHQLEPGENINDEIIRRQLLRNKYK